MSTSRANKQFGQAVRGRRKALTLSQAQTCDLAGVGLAFLYELERGKPTVRLDKVLEVLQVLGLGLQLCDSKEALSVKPPGEELGQ